LALSVAEQAHDKDWQAVNIEKPNAPPHYAQEQNFFLPQKCSGSLEN
jgi:hypothetical protein